MARRETTENANCRTELAASFGQDACRTEGAVSSERYIEILEIFAEEGHHGRCYDRRDGDRSKGDALAQGSMRGLDGVWRQWMTPMMAKAFYLQANVESTARRARRLREEERERRYLQVMHQEQTERLKRAHRTEAARLAKQKKAADAAATNLGFLRAYCPDCQRRPAGAGWCALHLERTAMPETKPAVVTPSELVAHRQRLPAERRGLTHHFTIFARRELQPLDRTGSPEYARLFAFLKEKGAGPEEYAALLQLANPEPDDGKGGDLVEVDGYLITGVNEQGELREVFFRVGKPGSTTALLDEWAKAVSMLLQYQAPIREVFGKFRHTRFEPSGGTRNPDIRHCTSLLDYCSAWVLATYAPDAGSDEETP